MNFKFILFSIIYGCSYPCEDYFYAPNEVSFCDFLVTNSIYIDNDFSNHEFSEIYNGKAIWEEATNNHVKFPIAGFVEHNSSLKEVNGIVIIRLSIDKDIDLIKKIDSYSNTGKPKGFVDGNKIYLIPERIGYGVLQVTITHELGHVLGLTHHYDSGSIMFPYYDGMLNCIKNNPKPTKTDIDDIIRLYCGG